MERLMSFMPLVLMLMGGVVGGLCVMKALAGVDWMWIFAGINAFTFAVGFGLMIRS